MNAPTPFPTETDQVAFDRVELNHILSLYGRMVSAGEWRDYGLSFLRDVAVFSVFRRAAEHPLYRIEKRPRLRNRQGMYAVIGMDGQVLKRGHDLRRPPRPRPQADPPRRLTPLRATPAPATVRPGPDRRPR
jgi:hypothetical protein